jgi:hypothetical protein
VNYCGSSSTDSRRTIGVTTEDDPNILTVESMIEAQFLLMTKEATS